MQIPGHKRLVPLRKSDDIKSAQFVKRDPVRRELCDGRGRGEDKLLRKNWIAHIALRREVAVFKGEVCVYRVAVKHGEQTVGRILHKAYIHPVERDEFGNEPVEMIDGEKGERGEAQTALTAPHAKLVVHDIQLPHDIARGRKKRLPCGSKLGRVGVAGKKLKAQVVLKPFYVLGKRGLAEIYAFRGGGEAHFIRHGGEIFQ